MLDSKERRRGREKSLALPPAHPQMSCKSWRLKNIVIDRVDQPNLVSSGF